MISRTLHYRPNESPTLNIFSLWMNSPFGAFCSNWRTPMRTLGKHQREQLNWSHSCILCVWYHEIWKVTSHRRGHFRDCYLKWFSDRRSLAGPPLLHHLRNQLSLLPCPCHLDVSDVSAGPGQETAQWPWMPRFSDRCEPWSWLLGREVLKDFLRLWFEDYLGSSKLLVLISKLVSFQNCVSLRARVSD